MGTVVFKHFQTVTQTGINGAFVWNYFQLQINTIYLCSAAVRSTLLSTLLCAHFHTQMWNLQDFSPAVRMCKCVNSPVGHNKTFIMWLHKRLDFEPNMQKAAAQYDRLSVSLPWDCHDARWVFPGSWRWQWLCDPAAAPGWPDTVQSARWLPARRSSSSGSDTQSSSNTDLTDRVLSALISPAARKFPPCYESSSVNNDCYSAIKRLSMRNVALSYDRFCV